MSYQRKIFLDIQEPSGAVFSNDRKHRYSLWRIWDKSKPLVMFIGLNPSTADETQSDPTIRSCERLAKSNGFGGFYMMNCWSYISTCPKGLETTPTSIEVNNEMLMDVAEVCKAVVFSWGSFDIVRTSGRAKELTEMFPQAKCLHINKNGSPKHPLYCKSDTQFKDWK